MNKRIFVILPVVVVVAIALALVWFNHRQTPAWRSELDRYLTYLRTTGQANYRLISFSPASQPANFTPAMSAGSFSDSVIFQTTLNADSQYFADLQPMPYPPEEVVCVLLGTGSQPQLVYVTFHNSLYNADWVVHISTESWNSPTLRSSLASLGCSLTE